MRCFLWAGFYKSPQGPPHWGASRAPGPKDGACLHKTPRSVPKRPAQCHPERGPSWLEPQALLGPPSQATEEPLMAQECPEATAAGAAWAPLGLGRGSWDAPAVRAAAKQTPEPGGESVCGQPVPWASWPPVFLGRQVYRSQCPHTHLWLLAGGQGPPVHPHPHSDFFCDPSPLGSTQAPMLGPE